jgi:hypothetical protein
MARVSSSPRLLHACKGQTSPARVFESRCSPGACRRLAGGGSMMEMVRKRSDSSGSACRGYGGWVDVELVGDVCDKRSAMATAMARSGKKQEVGE